MVTYQVIALVLPICQDEYQWTSVCSEYHQEIKHRRQVSSVPGS